MNKTKEIIKLICDDLNISQPKIKTKKLQGTNLAYYDIDEDTVYLNFTNQDLPNQVFIISHELRHKWQLVNGWEIQPLKNAPIKDYNLQAHEIDAIAYSYVFMERLGIKMNDLSHLGFEFLCALKTRIEQIKKEQHIC